MFRVKQKEKIFLFICLIFLWMYSPCLAGFNARYFNYPVTAPLSIALDFGQNLNDKEDEIGIYRTNKSKFLLKEDMIIHFGNRGGYSSCW